MKAATRLGTTDDEFADDVDLDLMADVFDDPPPLRSESPVLGWGRNQVREQRPVWGSLVPPPRAAPFDDKLAFYRGQHTTAGMRAAHLVAAPTAAVALPLLVLRLKAGLAALAAAGVVDLGGHLLFERDLPHPADDVPAHQLCALALWREEVADLLPLRRNRSHHS